MDTKFANEKKDYSKELSMDVDEVLKQLLKDFVSNDGNFVNFNKLKGHQFWKAYRNGDVIQVKDKNVAKGSEAQKKSFFINLYNVMCIYAVCLEETLPQEVLKVKDFFDKNLCQVSGEKFSLNDILHGILRANRPHPSSQSPYFGSNSAKLVFALKTLDPRVLFAINSADISSPPLRLFTVAGIEKELNTAVSDFCETAVSWNSMGRTIVLPRLLLWYRKDFPGGHDVGTIRWVINFLNPPNAETVRSLVDDLEIVGCVRIIHDNYDWRLNNFS